MDTVDGSAYGWQGLLMTAYLLWLGLTEAELSLWRAAGALAGIGATFAYPRLHAVAGAPTSLVLLAVLDRVPALPTRICTPRQARLPPLHCSPCF